MNNNILLKYVAGKCTTRQEQQVEHWLNESPQNRATMDEVKHISKVYPGKEIEVDTDEAWDAFSKHYFSHAGSNNQENINAQSPDKGKNSRQLNLQRLHKSSGVTYGAVATMVVLLAALLYYVAGFSTPDAPEMVSQKIITEKGQQTTVQLSDGTRIH